MRKDDSSSKGEVVLEEIQKRQRKELNPDALQYYFSVLLKSKVGTS
jgi:hypothetical protein